MKQVEITSKIIGRGGSTSSASPSLDLSGYALISDLLNYVTISGNEDVTGLHNFVNGLKVGGIELIQKNGNAFLKGNLVVEGGITMYGDGEGGSSIPSYSTLGSLLNVDESNDAVASVDRVLFQSAGSNVWSWKALSEIGGGSSGGSVSGAVRYLSTLGSAGSWYDNTYRLYGEWGLHDRLHLKTEGGYDVVANLAEKDGNGNVIASTYLPLSGGTLTGTLTIAPSNGQSLISERASGVPYISFRRSSSEYYGHIGVNSTGDPIMQSTVKGSTAWEKIWYEGNDGSGSGLDADLLDGVHAAFMFYARSKVITSSNVNSQMDNGVYYTAGYAPISDAYGYGTFLNFRSNAVGVNSRQAQFYIVDGAQVERGGRIYFRDSWNSTNDITTPWYEIITSKRIREYNAGSATKLQTARTIWGQSFDGSGNVDGRFLSSLNLSTSAWVSDTAQIRANATGTKYYIGVAVTTGGLAVIQGGDSGTGAIPLLLNPNGGNVGIGTTNPIYTLDVRGSACCKYISFYNTSGTSEAGWIGRGSEANNHIGLYASTGNNVVMYAGGYLCVTLTNQNALFSGGITMYSDKRKKTILNHVELSLKQIADAPLIEHYYNSDQDKTTHVGSIAQYWAELNDWFCKLDNEGFYTMEIQNCALASAISIARHLVKYESKTDRTIRKMKQRIQELEDEVERLKKGA